MSSESQEYNDSKESTNNEKKIDDKKHVENLMNVSYSYPDPADPELQKKIYEKREYILHRYNDRPDLNDYNDIKEYRDNICARSFTLHDHQAMLSNFINPDTPYKGVLVFHGLGSGKCLSKDALINVNGNLVLAHEIWNNNFTEIIKDEENGEWSIPKEELLVNSYDDLTRKIVKKKVTHLYREKVNTKLREIVLDNGSTIKITYSHKLLTIDGFTNNLSEGDYVCIPKTLHNFPEKNKLNVTNELAYLMGWQISEGHERLTNLKITQYDTTILNLIKNAAQKVGETYKLNMNNMPIRNTELDIWSKDYVTFLKKNGYTWYGNTSATKQFPSFIMNCGKEKLKIFLKAYFDAEGSVNVKKMQIEIASASEIIMKQLVTLLKIFGIYLRTTIKIKCATNTVNKTKRPYYYGYISSDDLITFQNEINFDVINKKEKLEIIANKKHNTNVKIIPYTKQLDELHLQVPLPKRQFINFHYLGCKAGIGKYKLQKPTINTLKETCKNLTHVNTTQSLKTMYNVDNNKSLILSKFVADTRKEMSKEVLYAKIISINEIDYDDYVYDLEIEDTHNFVAENIICHNTCVGVAIAEKFKALVQKYNTKIVILVGGPLIKENWKQHLLLCTGETYLKYQDKSVYIDDAEKAKNEKMAMIQALQYYKFMSYKSFYKHVIGEKITDRQSDKKGKVTYRKTAEGEFERDVAIDRIYNLNNTLVVIDEAHNLTGNTYGEALKYIIKNSTNLKVVLMSGTPMKNLGSDIIEMINFIRPLNSQIERDKVFNSEKGHLMDFKPGGLDYLKNMMRGYISHIRGADPLTFAKRYDKGIVPKGLMFTKVIRCDMLEFQKKTYMEAIEQNQEDTLDRKSEAVANFVFPVLSTDKKELIGHYAGEGLNLLKNQLKINGELVNKKLSKIMFGHENEKDLVYLTQDGHSITGKILKKENLKYFSIKFYKALKKIGRLVWSKKGVSTGFIYSNLVKVGISLFSEILVQNGYLEYQDDYNNYQINPNTVCYFCGKTHAEHNGNAEKHVESDSDSDDESDEHDGKPVKGKGLDLKISDSSTEFEYDKKKAKSIPPHTFRPATFIVITGKSNEEALEAMPEDKMNIIKNVFNTLENKDGRNLKLVLGSRVMNEGISLRHVKEVFVLDAYFNFGRIDQVVGRAIRHCSHYKLMSEENVYPIVNVYKFVVALEGALSTEEELYQKAELKYLLIKKIERAMKEVAIDCPLNRNGNIFKEEVEQFKGCEEKGDCPAICDYTSCSFICDDIKLNSKYYDPERMLYKKIDKGSVDYSTFTQGLARNEIEFAKDRIKEMYIMGSIYTLESILDHVKASYDKEKIDLFDEFFVFKALDELIPMTENDFNTYKDTIIDKHNRPGYIIYVNKYYIFQPFDQNEDIPMYYRTQVTNTVSQQQLSLYNYLKNTETYQSYREKGKQQKEDDKMLQKEDQPYYNFDDTMDYYDNRDEYDFVGFIDKEVSRRKTKSMEETKDVFKLREKRAKVLEKKRATGVPSLKGAVCETSKSKKYLQKVAGKLGITIPKGTLTRTDVCVNIRDQMLLLEKYSTTKEGNKFTYVMIPSDHPTFPFPYNLEDRVEDIINKIKKEVGSKIEIGVKTKKKTTGPEKGYPSYTITIKNDGTIKQYKDFIEKLGAKLESGNYIIEVE